MAIKAVELSAGKFGFDVHKMNVDFDAYVKKARPEYLEWLQETRKNAGPGSEKIGPHEGKYFNLMKLKLKPAAIVFPDEVKNFKALIRSGAVIDMGPLTEAEESEHVLVLKGEEWRGRAIKKLANLPIDQLPAGDLGEIKIGKLLGYSNAEIRQFIGR
jgi:hypothetical protein